MNFKIAARYPGSSTSPVFNLLKRFQGLFRYLDDKISKTVPERFFHWKAPRCILLLKAESLYLSGL